MRTCNKCGGKLSKADVIWYCPKCLLESVRGDGRRIDKR